MPNGYVYAEINVFDALRYEQLRYRAVEKFHLMARNPASKMWPRMVSEMGAVKLREPERLVNVGRPALLSEDSTWPMISRTGARQIAAA